ncbi:MAG: MATE family efflux transporter [Spirochaetes bacterium]|nr:MATE family efflux transporter [Spirochaetota bacterium]
MKNGLALKKSQRIKITPEEILKGSILKTLFRLAVPTMIAFTFQTAFNFIDRLFISRLGELQFGAVGMSFIVQSILIAIAAGAGAGSSSIISRFIGAEKYREANNAAEHSLLIVIITAVIFTIGGPPLSRPLFLLLGATNKMLPYILQYVNIILLGSFFAFFVMIGNGILRGEGNMIKPMQVMVAGTLTNIILDPLLIFGIGPFPEMGIRGAALATVIARAVSCLLLARSLFGDKNIIKFNLKIFKYSSRFIKGIFEVGGPSIISQLAQSLGLSLLFILLRPYGDYVKAAFTMGFTYQQVAFLPVIGIAMSVLTMTGQNYGAKNYTRLRQILNRASLAVVLIMLSFTAAFILGNKPLIRVFSVNPEVMKTGRELLIIFSIGFPFIALRMVEVNIFQGMGMGFKSLILNLSQMLLLTIPLALIISFFIGLNGIWIGMVIGNFITAVIGFFWAGIVTKKTGQISIR